VYRSQSIQRKPSPAFLRWRHRLPERAWSPFLNREVWLSPGEVRLLAVLTKDPGLYRQSDLAARAGYATVGGVSKALHRMRRLGLIALRTTRGRFGTTMTWLRAGVRRMFPPLQRRYATRHETTLYEEETFNLERRITDWMTALGVPRSPSEAEE
jgi:hypothetical protein